MFGGKRGLSRSTVRWCGFVLLLFGGFPWFYTPLIIPDRGMEGSGMLGTILFIIVGIPGAAAVLFSFFKRLRRYAVYSIVFVNLACCVTFSKKVRLILSFL